MLNYPVRHKIVLKGALKKYGTEFLVAGNTAANCIAGIASQIPELEHNIRNGFFRIRKKSGKHRLDLTEETITHQLSKETPQVIEVIPVIKGAGGKSGTAALNIIAGAAILAGGLALAAFTGGLSAGVSAALLSGLSGGMVSFGIALMCTGVATMLAPSEKEPEQDEAFMFTGATNIAKQGVPVPLVYGHIGVGSNMVASGSYGEEYGTEAYPMGRQLQNTVSTLKIVDLISEGEIVGLVNGESSFYLDKVPFREGDVKIENSSILFNTGKDNSIPENFGEVEEVFSSGEELKGDEPFDIVVTNTNVDYVVITLKTMGMHIISGSGNRHEASAGFQVTISDDNVSESIELYEAVNKTEPYYEDELVHTGYTGGDDQAPIYEVRPVLKQRYIQATKLTSQLYVKGNTSAGFEVSFRVDISHLNREKPRYIRIVRDNIILPPESGVNKLYLSSWTEIIALKVNYTDRAVAYLSFDAKEFQGNLPSRLYEVKGLIIDVPSNYNPETREYIGVWDGSFKKAWTNNPAWVFYDLLTNGRYGLGRDIGEAYVDKWILYQAAQYCDELVPNGFGEREPRFTFNGVINSRESAYKVLTDVAGVFRSMIYTGAGSVVIAQDAPKSVARTFSQANVIDGIFNYEGTGAKTRHSAVAVTWINPDTLWEPEVEFYEDSNLIIEHGLNILDITAMGCTSRGQALRIAKHAIYSEQYETDTVTFSVSLADCDLRPGDIIYIADEMIQEARLSGRLIGATATKLTLDYPVTLEMGQSYNIIITGNDNTIITRNLINAFSETQIVTIAGDSFTTDELSKIKQNCMWCISASNVQPRKYRVLSVAEGENLVFNVTALLHYDEKYKLIDEDISFDLPPISLAPDGALQPPTGLRVTPYLLNELGITRTGARIAWSNPADKRITGTEVVIKTPSSGEYINYGILNLPEININDVGVGRVEVQLRSYSDISKRFSKTVIYFAEVESPYIAPPPPVELRIESANSVITANWGKPQYSYELTYDYYLSTPQGEGTIASTLGTTASFAKIFNKYPANCTFYVRSVNAVGMKSDFISASVVVQSVNLDEIFGQIDKEFLTSNLIQQIGIDGTLNQIGESLLRSTKLIYKVMTASETALAGAVTGLTAKIEENESATASQFSSLVAMVGEQVKNPDGAYGLQWYDGTNGYPEIANPFYDNTQPESKENYPYLGVPSTSEALIGKIDTVEANTTKAIAESVTSMQAQLKSTEDELRDELAQEIKNVNDSIDDYYSQTGIDLTKAISSYDEEIRVFVGEETDRLNSKISSATETLDKEMVALTESVRTLQVKTESSIQTLQEEAIVAVDSEGNRLTQYTVKTDTAITDSNNNTVHRIRGFGLNDDGSNASFGVNAESFFVLNTNADTAATDFDRYLFYTDSRTNATYIGTDNTYFKGNIKSAGMISGQPTYTGKGFELSGKTGLFKFNSDNINFQSTQTGQIIWETNNNKIASIGSTTTSSPDAPVKALGINNNTSGVNASAAMGSVEAGTDTAYFSNSETSSFNAYGGTYAFKDLTPEPCWSVINPFTEPSLNAVDLAAPKDFFELDSYIVNSSNFLTHMPLKLSSPRVIRLVTGDVAMGSNNASIYNHFWKIFTVLQAKNREILKSLAKADAGSFKVLINPVPVFYKKDTNTFYTEFTSEIWFKTMTKTTEDETGIRIATDVLTIIPNTWQYGEWGTPLGVDYNVLNAFRKTLHDKFVSGWAWLPTAY